VAAITGRQDGGAYNLFGLLCQERAIGATCAKGQVSGTGAARAGLHWRQPPPKDRIMTNHVAKIIEIVGTSETSVEDAIQGAIARAAKTLDNLQWFEVIETRGFVAEGKVGRYQVVLKVAFGLEE
jgi:flavin-binding protein dodecin